MAPDDLLGRLESHRMIGQAPRKELAWIATHSKLRQLRQGELLQSQSEIVQDLFIVLSGRVSIHVDRGAGLRRVMEWKAGDVTGMLPYSRTQFPPGDAIVDEAAEIASLHRDMLSDLIINCPETTAILVHAMIDRTRGFTSTDLRDEKTIALGKLAAGLTHELNNPASAAVRDIKSLASACNAADEAARTLGSSGLTSAQMADLDAVRSYCITKMNQQAHSGLTLADREDAIADWLETHGIPTASAEDLARTPLTIEALDRLGSFLQGKTLDAALRWIASGCGVQSLILDIERATTRIHELVAAVKGFTQMDRALVQEPVEILRGLVDTVALLDGKAKRKSVVIALSVPPDLPPISGISAEVNQIWMNLVDNAIDAAPPHGHITVSAAKVNSSVVVNVVDDGPGIPAEIKETIFDPFFTTKPVGEGTGLGLATVRRIVQWQAGEIEVDSRPGHTEFRVRLPVAGAV